MYVNCAETNIVFQIPYIIIIIKLLINNNNNKNNNSFDTLRHNVISWKTSKAAPIHFGLMSILPKTKAAGIASMPAWIMEKSISVIKFVGSNESFHMLLLCTSFIALTGCVCVCVWFTWNLWQTIANKFNENNRFWTSQYESINIHVYAHICIQHERYNHWHTIIPFLQKMWLSETSFISD